jgi:hypothetical protein
VRVEVRGRSILLTPEGDAEYELLKTLMGMNVNLHWGSVAPPDKGAK